MESHDSWCQCMLLAADKSTCEPRAPAWRREYTGASGDIFFRLQDWAWGNTMMALRDALAVAIILNRRPKVIIGQGQSPLNGANLSSAFELFGVDVVPESAESRLRLATPAGAKSINSVDDLSAVLRRPLSPHQSIYSRCLFSFTAGSHKELRALAREHEGRHAWAMLFTAPVPDCWVAAFLRPAARVRGAVLRLLQGTRAAVHLRLCNLVSWTDTCAPVESPHAAARSVLGCAADTSAAASFFVASDSALAIESLKRDARAGNLSLPHVPRSTRIQVTSLEGLGLTAHLSRMAPQHEIDPQATLDRAVFDWAAFAYSRHVVALPSSFPASAVCMFAPAQVNLVVLRLPTDNGEVACNDPLSSSAGRSASAKQKHPCNDLARVNAKVLRPSKAPLAGRRGLLMRPAKAAEARKSDL